MWAYTADVEIDYFTKVLEDDLKAVTKPQYVDQIPKAVKGENRSVGFQMKQRCQVDQERLDEITDVLGERSRQTKYASRSLTNLQSFGKSGTETSICCLEENCNVLQLPWSACRRPMCKFGGA